MIFCVELFIFLKSEIYHTLKVIHIHYSTHIFNIVFELTIAIVADVLFTMASPTVPNCCFKVLLTYYSLNLFFFHE